MRNVHYHDDGHHITECVDGWVCSEHHYRQPGHVITIDTSPQRRPGQNNNFVICKAAAQPCQVCNPDGHDLDVPLDQAPAAAVGR